MKKHTISKLSSKAFLAGGISTAAFAILVGIILGELRHGAHFSYLGYLATILSFAAWVFVHPISKKLTSQSWSLRRKLVFLLVGIGFLLVSTITLQGQTIVSPLHIFGLFLCLLTLDTATEYLTTKNS